MAAPERFPRQNQRRSGDEACALWVFSPSTPLAGASVGTWVSWERGRLARIGVASCVASPHAGETQAFPGSRASAAVR